MNGSGLRRPLILTEKSRGERGRGFWKKKKGENLGIFPKAVEAMRVEKKDALM